MSTVTQIKQMCLLIYLYVNTTGPKVRGHKHPFVINMDINMAARTASNLIYKILKPGYKYLLSFSHKRSDSAMHMKVWALGSKDIQVLP